MTGMKGGFYMKTIAIIPARSGSKGLTDKNIRPLYGRPLLGYSVIAAAQSKLFDCIHVSTDSEEYAQIARNYGADVPFLRTEELSSDTAGSWDVVRWVLEQYAARGQQYDCVMLLQPTSPLREAADIRRAYRLFEEKSADAVVSVCETDHSPLWCNRLPEDGSMTGFLDQVANVGRQQLPVYYRINGAIYMLRTELLSQGTPGLYKEGTYAYVMPKERSIDIDDEVDFEIAQVLMKCYLHVEYDDEL